VLLRRAALSGDQVIRAILPEDVRRFDPDRFFREIDAAIHDHRARANHFLRLGVVLLDPEGAMSLVQGHTRGRAVVHDPDAAIVIEKQ
jgi:hypothetical protein